MENEPSEIRHDAHLDAPLNVTVGITSDSDLMAEDELLVEEISIDGMCGVY